GPRARRRRRADDPAPGGPGRPPRQVRPGAAGPAVPVLTARRGVGALADRRGRGTERRSGTEPQAMIHARPREAIEKRLGEAVLRAIGSFDLDVADGDLAEWRRDRAFE